VTSRVLITEPEYRKGEAVFHTESRLECLRAPAEEAALAAAIRETSARHVIVGLTTYTGPLYAALPSGGVIARFGVGHDGVDKAQATAAGLLCTNTPGVLHQSVAETTMMLIAEAARRFTAMVTNMSHGVWEPMMGTELDGKTLAIVGCGEIGRTVARIAARGYNMRVIGCSRPDAPAPAHFEHFERVTNDFQEAVRKADFVSLHLPARSENIGFLNQARLRQIPSRAWLINTARGSVVDEIALFTALSEGRIAGAALDVFVREPYVPVQQDADLRLLPNVILTPHIGSTTTEAGRRVAERTLQNILLAEAREFSRMDLVNRQVLSKLGA